MLKEGALLGIAVALVAFGCSKEESTEAAAAAAAAAEPVAVATAPAAVSAAPEKEPEKPQTTDAATAKAEDDEAEVAAETDEPAAPAKAPAKTAAAKPASAKAADPEEKKGIAGASVKEKKSTTQAFRSIQGCCNALALAASKGDKHKNRYEAAKAVCAGLAQQVKDGKADLGAVKTTLRAQLPGVPLPSGC